ncbi:MAG TPA: SpoIIE family protein phosphatase [Gallionella sp.]|nr:SpoIIE family protein phosphatase [Gallionella sp.]
MKLNVMVVDDTQINVTLISHLISKLEDCVAAGYTVPEQGLASCEAQIPDLLIVDYMMPGLDGIEFIRRFRALPGREDIPVLMVTANDQIEVRHQALNVGANDFLTKPIDKIEFMARVRNMLALRRSQRRLERSNLILNDEKELLEDIVTRMRSSSPFDTRGVRYIQSSLERTAGDIVLSAYRPDGAQHVLVGDFSGHGLPAAFGAPLASYIFYQLTAEGRDLRCILDEMNRTLYRQLPTQLYMAASALELSSDRKLARLWNYGLPPTLCLSAVHAMSRVDSKGLPLGIAESLDDFEPHAELAVVPGMCIYQYSDGITEAASPEQELYGQERLVELVARIYREQLPLEVIWTELERYCAGQGLSDDAAMVEVAV